MAELQNKQRPQVAASACKIIDKSALSAQFPPPALSACSSGAAPTHVLLCVILPVVKSRRLRPIQGLITPASKETNHRNPPPSL